MENITLSIVNNIELFFLILSRISGFLIISPIFSSRNIPNMLKVFINIFLTLIVFIVLTSNKVYDAPSLGYLLLNVVIQFIIGFLIGYLINLIFVSIQLAGQAIDMQMGFGIVNVVDPQSGIQMPLIGLLKYLLSLILFLIINGHHFLIDSLIKSFTLIPVDSSVNFYNVVHILLMSTAGIFITAIQIALPVVGAIFIADWVLGFMARSVPQLNVFMVGLPIKIIIGFIFISICLPVYIVFLEKLMSNIWYTVDQIMRLLV